MNIATPINAWTQDVASRFRAMFRSISTTNDALQNLQPCNCTVSTMTVCGKLDAPVPINNVLTHLQTNDLAEGLTVPDSPTKKHKGPANAFFNQLTVKAGNTSIKIFSNGAVHVTGVKSPQHFLDVVEKVCLALGQIITTAPFLEDASISMINAIFCAARSLPLVVLRQAFEDAGHAASYDPEIYPGINAKIASKTNALTTVMLFTTGNVIISGAKCPEDVASVYRTVCSVIDTLQPAAYTPRPLKYTSPDDFEVLNGYVDKIAHLCFLNKNKKPKKE